MWCTGERGIIISCAEGRSTGVISVQMSFIIITVLVAQGEYKRSVVMYRWKMEGVMCERKENRCQVTRADECKFDYHQMG